MIKRASADQLDGALDGLEDALGEAQACLSSSGR